MSFNVAVSGLHAAHKRLEVAGNNIANVKTSGFKSSRAEFSAVYSSAHLSSGSMSVGDGVTVANVSQDFSPGEVMSNSGRMLDMRIQGKGFFVVSDSGALSYTRAGAFLKDANDFVVDSHGSRLQGYAVNDKGEIISGVRTDLKINTGNLGAKTTTEVSQTVNLDSGAPSLAAMPLFKPDDPNSYTRMVVRTIQDSGVPEVKEVTGQDASGNTVIITPGKPAVAPQDHELQQYFVKTDDNLWTSYILVDGVNPLDPSTLSPMQAKLHMNADGKLSVVGSPAALQKASDSELSLIGWVPAIKQGNGWTTSPAGNTGPITLSLLDNGSALLDAADALIPRTMPVFDRADASTYSKPFDSRLHDTLGNEHILTQYYSKDGNNSWQLNVLVNGRNPQDPASSEPLKASMLFAADGSLQSLIGSPGLEASNGKLNLTGWVPAEHLSGSGVASIWAPNGALGNVEGISIDMSNLTQHRAESGRSSATTNGYGAGEITGLSIDKDGVINAGFSNSQHRKIGQVMLASFNNEQGLHPVSNTRWVQTNESGDPEYDAPGIARLGSIVGYSLEGSNVKLTEELVELIQAQTAYQASSKTLSTEAELMQTLIRAT